MSKSPTGDIKLELFGDGESFDPDKGTYVSTGYVFIFGGWQNSLSVICRNNEHDDGRKAARADIARRARPQLPLHDHQAGRHAGLERSTGARSCAGPIPSRSPAPATNTWRSTTGRPTSLRQPLDTPGAVSTEPWTNLRVATLRSRSPRWPPWRPAQVAAHLHARQPRSGRARGRAGAAAPGRARARPRRDAGLRRHRRARAEPRHGRQPEDAAHARSSVSTPTRSTPSRSSTASPRPATTRCPTATASTSSSITTRCAPAARAPRGATSAPSWARRRRSSSSTCASARLPIDAPLATAFFFALRTETRDLGRESTEAERQRVPRAGAARRPQPALPDDPPQGAARALRRARSRAALGAGIRRRGGGQPGRARLSRSGRRDRRPAAVVRGRPLRAVHGPVRRQPVPVAAHRSRQRARRHAHAPGRRHRRRRRAATARWPAPGCSRASRPKRSWR